jgi:hypothetical protein
VGLWAAVPVVATVPAAAGYRAPLKRMHRLLRRRPSHPCLPTGRRQPLGGSAEMGQDERQ